MTAPGDSPLHRFLKELEQPVALVGGTPLTVERLLVLLGRAERRAWRVEELHAPGLLAGRCPLGSGSAQLVFARPPGREPAPGAYVVALSLPVGPGRWVLLGRPAIVSPREASRFERLLASLRAPRGEFWRVHGGVISQAARAA